MLDEGLSAEIKDFNLTYLLIAQRLINDDPEGALLRLNISSETAEFFRKLTSKQMNMLASSSQLIVNPCFSDEGRLQAILDNPRERGLTETHVSIMLASASKDAVLPGIEGDASLSSDNKE